VRTVLLLAGIALANLAEPAHAAYCRSTSASEIVRGADAVFRGEILKDGRRVRVIEAFRGVRAGQVIVLSVPGTEGGERMYLSVRRVGPGRYHQEAWTGTKSAFCRSRNLERQVQWLRGMKRSGNSKRTRP
jgi:hypothetical protein